MAQHIYWSAQCEREDSRQGEQNHCVEDRAHDLPYHPENRHTSEQRQQDNERLLPVSVQQPASGQRQRRISRRFEFIGHLH